MDPGLSLKELEFKTWGTLLLAVYQLRWLVGCLGVSYLCMEQGGNMEALL